MRLKMNKARGMMRMRMRKGWKAQDGYVGRGSRGG